MKNLTPIHLRCGKMNCPSVQDMENGNLRIVGRIDPTLTVSEDGSPINPDDWGDIGQDETAIIVSRDLFLNVPRWADPGPLALTITQIVYEWDGKDRAGSGDDLTPLIRQLAIREDNVVLSARNATLLNVIGLIEREARYFNREGKLAAQRIIDVIRRSAE